MPGQVPTESRSMREQHGLKMEDQSRLRFGNYDLVRRIDVGGMGEVYLARQRTAFDRKVAAENICSPPLYELTAPGARFSLAPGGGPLPHQTNTVLL